MHFRGLYALVTGVLVFIAGFAVAQDESLVELRQLAEQGHIKSQVMLGFMYDTGLFPTYRRTMQRPRSGIAWPLSRAIPWHKPG